MPTAKPSITLEINKIGTLGAQAQPIEPRTNKAAPDIKLFLRPSLKEIQPVDIAPSAAPSIIVLTTHS